MNRNRVLLVLGILGLAVLVAGVALGAKAVAGDTTAVPQPKQMEEVQPVPVAVTEEPELEEAEPALVYEMELPIDWEKRRELVDGYTAESVDIGTAVTFNSYFTLDDQETVKSQLLSNISKSYGSIQVVNTETVKEPNLYGQEVESEHLLLTMQKAEEPLLADIYLYRRGDQGAQLIFLNFESKREQALKEMLELRKCLELVEIE